MSNLVPVRWRDGPFSGALHRAAMPEGVTIAEIVDSIPDLPLHFVSAGVICINGQQVPRNLWRYVRPRVSEREVVVTLHVAPGNSKTLALVGRSYNRRAPAAFIGVSGRKHRYKNLDTLVIQ